MKTRAAQVVEKMSEVDECPYASDFAKAQAEHLLQVYQCFCAAEDNQKDALRRLRATFYAWMDNIGRSIDEELRNDREEMGGQDV